MPGSEPLFSSSQVAELFGLASSSYSVFQRWIQPGLLAARPVRAASGDGRVRRYLIEPTAIVAFVRDHQDAYDWHAITDPLLRADAERVNASDPLLPIDEVLRELKTSRYTLSSLSSAGVIRLLVFGRPGVKGGRTTYMRRSLLAKARAELKRRQERIGRKPDPAVALSALHALLREPAPVTVLTPSRLDTPTSAAVRVGNGLVALASGPAGRPVVSDEARRCVCGTRRAVGRSEDGPGWELACLSCGRTEAIRDPAAEARAQAERDALRSEHRGPGRPRKTETVS